MRITIDPVPVVLGMYAYVGELLATAVAKRDVDAAELLGRRHSRQRGQSGDREVQKMVRSLHSDVKTADKLLKKTADVWKISQETDLVDLVILPRGGTDSPRAYVLLRPKELKPLLEAIREAAAGAGESEATLAELDGMAQAAEGKPTDYITFGFNPWKG
ncbi:MAG: hypothetical protein ABIV28_06315 [Longimicrobiales bacterium]